MDDSNIQKVWERPWSTEEMRAHCSSWNLAGDAGLLKHLQEFSQNLMQKTHTAEVALDSLLEDMRNTSVDVQNATNALLMLSNNQFVENRVYDDCEDEKEEVDGKSDDATLATAGGEGSLIAKAAEAIMLGMSVIDTKFDCVEVPASDSEGEEDAQNASRNGRKSFAVVLEPRNPYALQPLPHLIGSKEFMEDDRVGLGCGDEEDDEEEEEDDDVHLSIGQDLVAQGLNDSGSSLTGDMGDEGAFDEDEVEDQRVQKASVKQAWESSSSNGSDDLVVENNVIRKKLLKNMVSQNDEGPFGHDDVESDIFGGKESSSGDEFPPLANREPPKKLQEEDFEEAATKPVTVNRKKRDDESEKKKANGVNSNATHAISSDNLFGPSKDEWKDDEDGDSIFASTDGIFSGGRGLFDDLNDPFASNDQRDANRFQPPHPPYDKPPVFKGGNGDIAVPQERKEDMFGDDEQDVFANILVKVKPPSQKQKTTPEAVPRKELAKPGSTQRKDLKGLETEGADSWLFDDEADLDDPLWNVGTTSKKEKGNERVGEPGVPKAHGGLSQKEDEVEEDSKAVAQPKLPVGARSFYSGGIDPFALGKKLTKELEDKQKVKQERDGDDDHSGKMDVSSDKAAPERGDDTEPLGGISEKRSVKDAKHSPDSASLFDGLDEGDDLFAPVSAKVSKPKDMTSSKKGDLFDDGTFSPQKAPPVSTKVEDKQRKTEKKTPFLDVENSKNLFGDFASDDDDDIFSSSNSLGGRYSISKPLPNKGKKEFIDSSDPLFDNGFGKDEELFPGSLEKNIFSEKEAEDDLFTGLTKTEEGKDMKNKKKESSNSIKTEFQVPLRDDGDNDGPEDTENISHINKTNTSDNMFGPIDAISSEKKDASASKKAEASRDSKVKPTSHKKIKNESDDIFGDSESNLTKVPGTKSVTGVPSIDILSGRSQGEDGNIAESKSYNKSEKGSKLENLFDDFENDDSDFLSNKKRTPSKPVQPSSLPETNSTTKKTNNKDLFSEFDSDGDDQTFSTPKGGKKMKADSLYIDDPLSQEDDLFSSLKPPVVKKASTPSMLDDDSLVFSFDSDRKKTGPSTSEDHGKGDSAALGKGRIPVDKDITIPHAASGGSAPRKSPPKTLNLERVIPSPKPASKMVDLDDDFFGSNEDDKIVEAWMKGHPPPLRDSKVETAMDDDVTPGYTPAHSYDDFGPSGNGDQDSSYFADIPSASLLRSHGKERARIQSHRRPPSRKVRKGSAASVEPLPVTLEGGGKPDPPMSSVALPSRDSVEEDGGSQGTIEEWSTPEAALASPPRTLPTTSAPRSNPLSPSTDEEQDFFDVLPVGHHYPPPMMDPSVHLSDALGVEEGIWDDCSLFEDAQPMDQGGVGALWASDKPPLDTTTPGSGWTPVEESGNESRSSKLKPVVGGEGSGGGRRGDVLPQAARGPGTESGKARSEQEGKLPKKTKKSHGKQESGKLDDDLWGNGLNSRITDDIFAEDLDSSRTGDFDDLFQGHGDLFGPSRVSASTLETKRVMVGNVSEKSMGKSLSKLDSKSKAPVSLFDDDDDTEDLFSPHSSQPAPKKGLTTTRKSNTTRAVVPEQPAKSSLLKVAADDTIFEDPLMVLKRKD